MKVMIFFVSIIFSLTETSVEYTNKRNCYVRRNYTSNLKNQTAFLECGNNRNIKENHQIPKTSNTFRNNNGSNSNLGKTKLVKLYNKAKKETNKKKFFKIENRFRNIQLSTNIESLTHLKKQKLNVNKSLEKLMRSMNFLPKQKRRKEEHRNIFNEMEFEVSNDTRNEKLIKDSVLKNNISLLYFVNTSSSQINNNTFETITVTRNPKRLPGYQCQIIQDQICRKVQSLNTFKCRSNNSNIITLMKLCDGNDDCPDRSDEENCRTQVNARVSDVQELFSTIAYFFKFKCVESSLQNILSEQITFLELVLTENLWYDENQTLNDNKVDKNDIDNDDDDDDPFKVDVKELFLIVNSLILSIDGGVCYSKNQSIFFSGRKYNVVDKESNLKNTEGLLLEELNCNCKDHFCPNCPDACKIICWQSHVLTKWTCESFYKTESIPLSSLCDGKIDCYDKSDEENCANTFGDSNDGDNKDDKIILSVKFKNIYDMINWKIKAMPSQIAKIMHSLKKTILEYQNRCESTHNDQRLLEFKRNECFLHLSSTYRAIVKYNTTVTANEIFKFLLSINRELVDILKVTSFGNSKLLFNYCRCSKGLCISPICTKRCDKSCAVEHQLTVYHCKSSHKNTSFDKICDGNVDCPDGDDEAGCAEDICRRENFISLSKHLRDVGVAKFETSAVTSLASWNSKALSMLGEAAKNSEVNASVFKKLIKDIWSNLVLTYASHDWKNNKKYVLEQFSKAAKIFYEALRSCK